MKTKTKEIILSVIVIARNEEEKIVDCLESVDWADEIIVVDTGSKDNTFEVAIKYTDKAYRFTEGSFNDWRNYGLSKAIGKWVLYLDTDERITPALKKEISEIINKPSHKYSAFAISRRNVILGKEMKHGGWWPDYVIRLFLKEKLKNWEKELHEEPKFEGGLLHLKNPMVHIKHDNLSDMIEKTNKWSKIEAELLIKAKHPKMVWWRFIRIMLTELWYRLAVKAGFRDGVEGVIYAFYQSWSKFVTYAKLWEMQLEPRKSTYKS